MIWEIPITTGFTPMTESLVRQTKKRRLNGATAYALELGRFENSRRNQWGGFSEPSQYQLEALSVRQESGESSHGFGYGQEVLPSLCAGF